MAWITDGDWAWFVIVDTMIVIIAVSVTWFINVVDVAWVGVDVNVLTVFTFT
jgi:hypothetical protein